MQVGLWALLCKGVGTSSLQCHSFVAIVRPEAIGSRMVAVTRGIKGDFFIQAMDVNSHFFHYWHGMTVFIRGVIIVVVVVKWSYFPRPAVSVYLRVTNQAFPQCLWIKQEVSFPKLWFRLSSLISRKTPSLRSCPLPIIPLCLEPQKQKKEKKGHLISVYKTPHGTLTEG